MKKIICLVLSITVFFSSLLVSSTVFAYDENSNKKTKSEMIQYIEEMYGEQAFSDASESGHYGFEEEITFSDELKSIDDILVDIEDFVSPQWENTKDPSVKEKNHAYGTHGYIIENANKEADSSTEISEKYLPLVYAICKKCDTEYGVGKKDYCSVFHGNSNYFATIHYLWKFARKIGANKSKVKDSSDEAQIDNYIDWASNETYNGLSEKVKTRKDEDRDVYYFKELSQKAAKMVKTYYKTDSNLAVKTNQSWGGRCKYIIYGMVSHCLGDIYAHKVMLKPSAAAQLINDSVTFDKNTMLKKSDFINWERYYVLKSRVSGIANQYSDNTNPIAIFQLKKFTDVTSRQKQAHHDYADNPEFYKNRVKESIVSFWYFIDYYSTSEYKKDTKLCLEPGYGYTLYNYDEYKNEF